MRLSGYVIAVLLATGCSRKDDYSVSGLMKMFQEGDPAARCTAVEALGKYGAEAKPAIPLLQTALRDSDATVRVSAAYALAGVGTPAEPALPDLLLALKSPDVDLRLAAAYAVPSVAPRSTEAASAVQQALRDRDPRVREEAKRSSRKMQLAAQLQASPAADQRH